VTEPTERLAAFCDETFGGRTPIWVERLTGGGSCEVFAVDRGDQRWVLRRAPRRANTSRAHDVIREFRILDAIKDQPVRIARPVAGCADPEVFGSPFFLMERIDGVPLRSSIPAAWTDRHADAVWDLLGALVQIHAVDWYSCGLADLAHSAGFLGRQIDRWVSQLAAYGGRALLGADRVAQWLRERLPPEQPQALCHGDYKFDNALFAPTAPPDLLAVVDWEMASIGDPLVDLCWMLVFHPGRGGIMPLAVSGEHPFDRDSLPSTDEVIEQYAVRSGRDTAHIEWYQAFARWKMAIVLEGSYAKFQRGDSDNPLHEHFGSQADRALEAALAVVDAGR
jgi:aminoglycoside phosphotransferase (APT) family kinase protein